MADYYADHERGADPFAWIRGWPLMDEEIISQIDAALADA